MSISTAAAETREAVIRRRHGPQLSLGGVNALLGDGSVRFVKSTINGWT